MESFCSVLQYCVLFFPGFANLAVCCYMFALLNITIKYFSVHQTDRVGYLSFFVCARFMKIESRWTYFYSNLIIKVNAQNQLCPRCQILCRVCKYYQFKPDRVFLSEPYSRQCTGQYCTLLLISSNKCFHLSKYFVMSYNVFL